MPTYKLLISEHTGYYVDVEAETEDEAIEDYYENGGCLLYTSPSPRDGLLSRMPSSA